MTEAVTDESALATATELQEESTRQIARDAAPDMVRHLIKLAKGHKLKGDQRATPNVQRQAAVDVITQANGRPETRQPGTAEGGGAGVTVIVNQLFADGPSQKLVHGERTPIEEAMRTANSAIEVAAEIQNASSDQRKDP